MGATERISQFIEFKGISKYKFCKDLGFSNKFLDNSSNMGTDKACKILHYYPEINAEWLLTGNGEMLKGISVVHKADNEPVVYRELVESMKKTIALQDEKIARLEKELAELKYSLSNNPIVYSNVAEPPPELKKGAITTK